MDKTFLKYLMEYLHEDRKQRFEDIITQRTRYATVVLEDLYQPHNASAVMRSCDCFGIQDVHIIENLNPWKSTPDIERGSSKWLSLHHYREYENNTDQCLAHLKNQGYQLVATTPHTSTAMSELPLTQPLAFIFGNEGYGVSEKVIAEAGHHVKIPMYGFTESFNISVSAAILMHDFRERLKNTSIDWKLSEAEQTEILLAWCSKSLKHFYKYEKQYFENKKG